MARAFGACEGVDLGVCLGRCPRLVWNGPLALQNPMLPARFGGGHLRDLMSHAAAGRPVTGQKPSLSH